MWNEVVDGSRPCSKVFSPPTTTNSPKFQVIMFLFCVCNISGINGVLALKDEAYKRGWLVVAHQHFEPVPDSATLDVSKQLKWIRQTGTRIVVLNCYVKYSRQVR